MSDQVLREGSVFHEKYQVVRSIAQGGMGAVYEVIHLETQRKRALKVMLPSVVNSEELRNRFRAEARVASGIESEHVVETFDAGVDRATGMPFLVMELLRGQELAKALATVGRYAPERAIPMLGQVARTLDKTHAARVVHRDLKPENLFLTATEDGTMRVKILDFGIAKIVAEGSGADKTKTLGTPLYMAPEQFDGSAPISAQTDLFALAHITFTVLTGSAFWSEEMDTSPSLYGFLMAMQTDHADPATARAARRGATLPPAFDAWFARATAKRSVDRFRSAGEQHQALEQIFGITAPATMMPATYGANATVAAAPMGAAPATQASYGSGPHPLTSFSGPSVPVISHPGGATQLGGPPPTAYQAQGPVLVPAPARTAAPAKSGGSIGVFVLIGLLAVGGIGGAAFFLTRSGKAKTTTASASAAKDEPRSPASAGATTSTTPAASQSLDEITFVKKDPAVGSKAKQTGVSEVSIDTTAPAVTSFKSEERNVHTTTILAADGKTVLKEKIEYGEQTKTETKDGTPTTTSSPVANKAYIAEYKDGAVVVLSDNYKPVPPEEEAIVKKAASDLGSPSRDLTALPDVPVKKGDRVDTLAELLRSAIDGEGKGEMSDVVVTLKDIEVVNGVKRGIFQYSLKYVQHEDEIIVTMTLSGTFIIRADTGQTIKMDYAGPVTMSGSATGTGKMSAKEEME